MPVQGTFKEYDKQKQKHLANFRRFVRMSGTPIKIREYVSINVFELREWIQLQWIEGMTWENYGSFWVIDHVVPLRIFNIFDENDLRISFHYKNLMPLIWKDNNDKEGDLRFSQIVLDRLEPCPIVNYLKNKVEAEIKKMEKYFVK